MLRAVVLLSLVSLMAASAAPSASKPKPYAWTTAQGPSECASFGSGYFNCWFGLNGEPTDPGMGHATVILAPKPIITISAMPS